MPLFAPLFQSVLLAQASMAAPPSLAEDRLQLCLEQARTDPATAIANASAWEGEAYGAEKSYPQQCLGFAYTSLLRWEAAEAAFLAAREARLPTARAPRARLAAMAGNAAMAGERHEDALVAFDLAATDALVAGEAQLMGEIAADRARALVGLGRLEEAASALAQARRDAPQDAGIWLLSATLSRRQERLEDAQQQIETAAALAPDAPSVALEAGLIAAMIGRDEAARRSWRSIVEAAPQSHEALAASSYLAQLDGGVAGR